MTVPCGKWESLITVPTGDWTATLFEMIPAAVVWAGATNLTATGNDLEKTGGGSDWTNNDAQGDDTIAGAGYIEAVLGENTAIALDAGTSTSMYLDDFALVRGSGAAAFVFESGVQMLTIAPFLLGTEIARVQRVGSTVTYWVNGVLIYTSTATPAATLTPNAHIYAEGGTIADAMVADAGAGAAITLTAAKTYYHSSAGNDTLDLPAKLAALLDAAGAATYTVTIGAGESGTGLYTISATGGSVADFALTWTNTALRDLLGYTGTISGALSHVATNNALGLWLPDGPPRSLCGISDPIDESDETVTETTAGHVYRLTYSRKTVIDGLTYQGVSHAKTRIAGETTANASLQRFWRDAVQGDQSYLGTLRIYPDADTDGTYSAYAVGAMSRCEPTALADGWLGYWTITFPRLVSVPA
jgi:hypothetical protein